MNNWFRMFALLSVCCKNSHTRIFVLQKWNTWRIWVMNMNFELCQQIEWELELWEDVGEFFLWWRFGSNRQHAVAKIFLFRLATATSLLLKSQRHKALKTTVVIIHLRRHLYLTHLNPFFSSVIQLRLVYFNFTLIKFFGITNYECFHNLCFYHPPPTKMFKIVNCICILE